MLIYNYFPNCLPFVSLFTEKRYFCRVMGKILCILTIALALLAGAHKISSVETSGSWVYLYDDSGHRYKTLSASNVGVVKGFSSNFFVTQNGSWIYLYDSEGQRYKTLSASSVGEVTGVSGETFTSRNGAWIYTWDRDGKKVNTRAAR